jgi:hydrogenase small subunit
MNVSGARLAAPSLPKAAPLAEMDVLWITGGLSCDGDTIAMTAATQPSIEDIVRGAIPWIPKVNLYNPFPAFENGDEFMQHFIVPRKGSSHSFW